MFKGDFKVYKMSKSCKKLLPKEEIQMAEKDVKDTLALLVAGSPRQLGVSPPRGG